MIGAPGVVVYRPASGIDAIDEHSRRLAAALCAAGRDADYVSGGPRAVRRRDPPPPWVLLQYNPFSYGRWGVAPRLVTDAARLRRRGVRVVLMVHESWIELRDWRTTAMGAYQWAQLRALLAFADAVLVATEALAREVRHDAMVVPVGSNITPAGIAPDVARSRLGLGDELVVGLFGTHHPSRALDHAEAAIAALADAEPTRRVTVLNLGVGARPLRADERVHVVTPGGLAEPELSLRLSATDLCLLPFTDGVSTRRTTLMAALAHGVAVLTVQGTATDALLADQPRALELTPAGDLRAYALAAVRLAADRPGLRARGEAGRRLYETRFDWPVIARRVSGALGGAAP